VNEIDPILGVTEAFKADTNPKKMNLGVGNAYYVAYMFRTGAHDVHRQALTVMITTSPMSCLLSERFEYFLSTGLIFMDDAHFVWVGSRLNV
jgi:hypothetical protein